jgi:multicomponent Na+:H+ antiporter subunit E
MSWLNNPAQNTGSAALFRAAVFLTTWIALTHGRPGDVVAGVAVAAIATWASLKLLPAGPTRLSLRAFVVLARHFFSQSIVAGIDVARRAFDPNLPIRPGLIVCACDLHAGPARNAFCALSSLLPGTIPVRSEGSGTLLIHCLDTDQAIAAQMTEDERLFRQVLAGRPR